MNHQYVNLLIDASEVGTNTCVLRYFVFASFMQSRVRKAKVQRAKDKKWSCISSENFWEFTTKIKRRGIINCLPSLARSSRYVPVPVWPQ